MQPNNNIQNAIMQPNYPNPNGPNGPNPTQLPKTNKLSYYYYLAILISKPYLAILISKPYSAILFTDSVKLLLQRRCGRESGTRQPHPSFYQTQSKAPSTQAVTVSFLIPASSSPLVSSGAAQLRQSDRRATEQEFGYIFFVDSLPSIHCH
ncbi:hypothetical protein Dimus_026861 [Dionaea muscipula]